MSQQYPLPLPQTEAMGLEDFLPAPSNAQALHWLVQTAPSLWPAHALVLWGPEGSGKTHLLSIWQARHNATPLALGDAETLARLVAEAPETGAAFVLDNADRAAGNAAQEEWLQHLFNATKAAQTPLLLTSRTPPAQWGLKLPDILTRLKSCPAVALEEPDDELMRGLLLKLFADRQLMVEAGVVEYIAARLERTGTAARHAVKLLDEAALEGRRKISVPFAQKILFA